MAFYYDKPEVGLHGISSLHRWSARTEVAFARGLLDYLNVRGGRAHFDDIHAPSQQEGQLEYLDIDEQGNVKFDKFESKEKFTQPGSNVVSALSCLLLGKRAVYDYILKIYEAAVESKDPQLTDFLEVNYIRPVANVNRKLSILQAQANLASAEGSVGIYQFNKDVQKNLDKIIVADKLARPDKWSIVY